MPRTADMHSVMSIHHRHFATLSVDFTPLATRDAKQRRYAYAHSQRIPAEYLATHGGSRSRCAGRGRPVIPRLGPSHSRGAAGSEARLFIFFFFKCPGPPPLLPSSPPPLFPG